MVTGSRDKFGIMRVEVSDHHSNIAAFLEGDIQSSTEGCREYIAAAEDVEAGHLPMWSGTGNAHTITIKPDGVIIENVWDESLGVAELSISEFKHCLESWLRLISLPSG